MTNAQSIYRPLFVPPLERAAADLDKPDHDRSSRPPDRRERGACFEMSIFDSMQSLSISRAQSIRQFPQMKIALNFPTRTMAARSDPRPAMQVPIAA